VRVRSTTAALGAVVALTVSACGGGNPIGDEERAPRDSTSIRSASTTPSPPSQTKPIALGPSDTFRLGSNIGPFTAEGHMVFFPARTRSGRNWDSVASVDMISHDRRAVAHTAFSEGLINWVGAAGTWVVYVDQSARQSDAQPDVLWRVIAVESGTGHRVVLASNGEHPNPFVPILQSQSEYVFWTQAETDRSAQEVLWRPGWVRPREVLRHANMSPGSASISDDHLVYLGGADAGAAAPPKGGDCWRVPLTGGSPEALTHTGLAMGCFATDGELAWTLHIDPETKDQPSDGILDDPYELWAMPGDGAARLLRRGYFTLTRPSIGANHVIWQTYEQRLVLQSIEDPARQIVLPGRPATRPQTTEHAIVYVTENHGLATAHVVPLASIND
jgi:hypothetical protein